MARKAMTNEQARRLVNCWAEYRLGAHDTRVLPNSYSAPMSFGNSPGSEFFDEYQHVQREIESYCRKSWDRAMLVAILEEQFWRGGRLVSQILSTDGQERAEHLFIADLEGTIFNPEKRKVEIA